MTQNLLVELLVEELPPKALQKLGTAFADTLAASLRQQGLLAEASTVTPFASPRRLAVHISQVAAQAADRAVRTKLMPVSVALDAAGHPTPALLKKLAALGLDATVVPQLQRAPDGKAEALFHHSTQTGATLANALQKALDEAITRLPIPKVMTYQPETGVALPGWDSVQFVRPVHALTALHGTTIVPVQALGLVAGRSTQGHRFEAHSHPIQIPDADSYADTLLQQGAVIASFEQRRAAITAQLQSAAQQVAQQYGIADCKPIDDADLLNEVTALVERPNVLACQFDQAFLDVPQECLILTMKANQKYFPLLDGQGRLTRHFLVVSNITPDDPSAVIGGNERVVRPRLADAKFFFDQDRKKTLASRVEGLSKVVYHNKLGTQAERSERVRHIARAIVQQWQQLAPHMRQPSTSPGTTLAAPVDTAAHLAKADLLTDMVGEFPELQGIMGGYYARHDGLSEDIAQAIEDHYRPRFAGDALPRGEVGIVVALADKLETLVGMFGIGNLPTGDKDPFALRRHALGVIRMLLERNLPLHIDQLLADATPAFAGIDGFDADKAQTLLLDFIFERLAGLLHEQGASAQEAAAVLSDQGSATRPYRLGEIPALLAAVRAFVQLPEAPALAAANKRISNILKKANVDAMTAVDVALLQEDAEKALYAAMQQVLPQATAQFNAGDYTASLQTLSALRSPVDAFFDDVMVNAEQPELRRNRISLLQSLHQAMNRIADLAQLAV